MKKKILFLAVALLSLTASASVTLPVRGTVIPASDPNIQYIGRVNFNNPDSPMFTYPGVQINACFEGTSLRMIAKPESGYFMATIDGSEAFKVAFTGVNDSLVTLAVALPQGRHTVRLMYCIEGLNRRPEFRGFVLDEGCRLLPPPALPERKIEFIGNSITCGYGSESMNAPDPFEDATENHYYTYAAITTRNLNAMDYVVARSGIGAYRCYDGAREGTPNQMPKQYEYTNFDDFSQTWDFNRYTPQVVCINLGTNDLSTPNFDIRLFAEAYSTFLGNVRKHYPKAKIVLLTGCMLNGKELELQKQTLDQIQADARKNGDNEVYRFDFTPQNGDLKYGASWHPSYWQHQKMAAELTAYLRVLMGWF